MQVMTENKVVPKLRFGEFVSEWKTNRFGDDFEMFEDLDGKLCTYQIVQKNAFN